LGEATFAETRGNGRDAPMKCQRRDGGTESCCAA
jgi:hypothetical protein